MMYITYEEPLKGKTLYPDFECWKSDMLKSGVFQRV